MGLTVEELSNAHAVEQLVLDIIAIPKIDFDPVYAFAASYCDAPEQSKAIAFMREVVAILYRVGAVGVRLRHGDRISYSHIDEPVISPALVAGDVRVRIHPMLHATLKLVDG